MRNKISALFLATVLSFSFISEAYSQISWPTPLFRSSNLSDVPSDVTAARNLQTGYILGQSAVAVSVSATTSEETLATITVPANSMGANGCVEILAAFTMTNSANNKTMRFKFGGAATTYRVLVATTSATFLVYGALCNRNATNSQVSNVSQTAAGAFGSSINPLVTSAVDTTANVDITITGQKASSGETLTLENYMVRLYPRS